MNIRLLQTVALLLFTIPAVADESHSAIATVNGSIISADVLGMYGEKRIGVKPGLGFPEQKRKELINELINRELIYQDAIRQGIDKDKFVQLEINELTHNLLTRSRIGKLLSDNPPSEKMMQEIYQAQIVGPTSTEYSARHILLATMEEAKFAIEKLNGGGNFEELAKQLSTGPSSTQGGDLGWFSPNQMAKNFSKATEKLSPGEYTKRPVKTRFGWHIIKLEEVRKVEPPPIESVHEDIMKIAQNKIINDYIEKLKGSATIDIHSR